MHLFSGSHKTNSRHFVRKYLTPIASKMHELKTNHNPILNYFAELAEFEKSGQYPFSAANLRFRCADFAPTSTT
jgi:hypothetical protein